MDQFRELAFRKILDVPLEEAIEQVTFALKTEGFGILTKIDVKSTFKDKLNKTFRKYVILGACNPPFAYRTLSTDLDVGLLLPCNVIVYVSDDGSSIVAAINPIAMLNVINSEQIKEIAEEVSTKIERSIQSI